MRYADNMDWSSFLEACRGVAHGFGSGEVFSGAGLWSQPLAMLLLGLTGGLTHCTGMCGPFVLAQVGSRLAATPIQQTTLLTRLSGMALLPYHLGRATTYTALGAVAGGLFGGVGEFARSSHLPAFGLMAAALLFLALGLRQMSPRLALAVRNGSGAAHWLAPFFARPSGFSGYALGLGLGFLPCGLLYTALLMAGAAGDWRRGAAAMAAFALGTALPLAAFGGIGALIAPRLPPQAKSLFRRLLVPVLLLNALLAALLALHWLAF